MAGKVQLNAINEGHQHSCSISIAMSILHAALSQKWPKSHQLLQMCPAVELSPSLFTSAHSSVHMCSRSDHRTLKISLSKVRNFTPVRSLWKESSSLTRDSVKRAMTSRCLGSFVGLSLYSSFLLEQDQQGRAPFILYHMETGNNTGMNTELFLAMGCICAVGIVTLDPVQWMIFANADQFTLPLWFLWTSYTLQRGQAVWRWEWTGAHGDKVPLHSSLFLVSQLGTFCTTTAPFVGP